MTVARFGRHQFFGPRDHVLTTRGREVLPRTEKSKTLIWNTHEEMPYLVPIQTNTFVLKDGTYWHIVDQIGRRVEIFQLFVRGDRQSEEYVPVTSVGLPRSVRLFVERLEEGKKASSINEPRGLANK